MEVCSGFSRLLATWNTGTCPGRDSSSKPIWGHLLPSPALNPEPGGSGGGRKCLGGSCLPGGGARWTIGRQSRAGDVAQPLLLLQRNRVCLPAPTGWFTIVYTLRFLWVGLSILASTGTVLIGTQTHTQVRHSHKVKINI